MFGARRKTTRRPLRQRLTAAAALCAYLAAAMGLPVPAAMSPRETGEPFPCMEHPCGCRTAEQCWTSCCCFTPEQRWAWARAHHVQPPAYAERPAAAAQGWSRKPLREQAEDKAASAEERNCCRAEKTSCADTACGRDCSRRPTTPPSEKSPAPGAGFRWVLGVSAQRCQALTTLWVLTGTTLSPPRAIAGEPSEDPAGWLLTTDTIASLLSHTPPAPPPR